MKSEQEEFKDYKKAGFQAFKTEDQSYSLIQEGLKEEMHSRGGALSESLYIYGEALELFLELYLESSLVLDGPSTEKQEAFEVLSLGLGLGINEVLALSKLSKFSLDYHIRSYEKESVLIDLFQKRVQNPLDYPEYWKPFKLQEVSFEELKFERLQFFGAFNFDEIAKLESKQRVVFYDAYSSKSSQELWTPEILMELLSKCKKGSIFATYAATGVLNRALKEAGFKNLKKKGYKYKRESTLAIKKSP